MKHIKNLIHNINDIALALIIVIIAAGIIYWRIQVILDYPQTVISGQSETVQEIEEVPTDSGGSSE